MLSLGRGKKDPNATAGSPFPPAAAHTDGPDHRPDRDVPAAGEPAGGEAGADPDEEENR